MRSMLKTNWSLATWQAHLRRIYDDVNRRRDPSQVHGRMLEAFSGLARGVRDHSDEQVRYFAPRAVAWLMALASRFDVDLQCGLWEYYPGVCAHCRKESNCRCIIGRTARGRISLPAEIAEFQARFERPEHLDDWLAMFRRIFYQANAEVGELKCLAHVTEELGEVHEAVRHTTTEHPVLSADVIRVHLVQELCDLFAWFAAILNLVHPEIDSLLKNLYFESCPDCNSNPCSCAPDFVHDSIVLTGRSQEKSE